MFEDDDEIVLVNPLSKLNSKPKKKVAKVAPVIAKKPNVARRKEKAQKLQVQDCVGEVSSKDTFVVHISGDECWTIIKEDAERLTDHMIYCYFYKRFGYKARELKIVRPAS